jgi:hypothetical protein
VRYDRKLDGGIGSLSLRSELLDRSCNEDDDLRLIVNATVKVISCINPSHPTQVEMWEYLERSMPGAILKNEINIP